MTRTKKTVQPRNVIFKPLRGCSARPVAPNALCGALPQTASPKARGAVSDEAALKLKLGSALSSDSIWYVIL